MVLPEAFWKYPGSQALQATVVLATFEYRPGGHSVQLTEPRVLEYDPLGHSV